MGFPSCIHVLVFLHERPRKNHQADKSTYPVCMLIFFRLIIMIRKGCVWLLCVAPGYMSMSSYMAGKCRLTLIKACTTKCSNLPYAHVQIAKD